MAFGKWSLIWSKVGQILHMYGQVASLLYFIGICMLLTVLEEQAMDSLLLGPDKQNDFMQTILHTMEKETAGN